MGNHGKLHGPAGQTPDAFRLARLGCLSTRQQVITQCAPISREALIDYQWLIRQSAIADSPMSLNQTCERLGPALSIQDSEIPSSIDTVTMKFVNTGHFEFTFHPSTDQVQRSAQTPNLVSVVRAGTSRLLPGHIALYNVAGKKIPLSTRYSGFSTD